MSKIIIKKTKNKSKNQEKTNNNLTTPTTKETKMLATQKLPLLQKITYTIIILNSLLSLLNLYYENKIPWFTTGINNLINLIKSIILGGK
ncbi:hypothetical protein RS022_06670 [Candidatus Phytoplasma rubi]|uniref:Uncharacterized protein n=1 Tax=Candidatus Phytoplasma rubi TaxID=399025 RepID=A0ABY7BWD6_9MOLU|nr:hypothetical protein [Candidatus Phytoplasma rubi]WAN63037.1 hypothetical protein RS022_00260 [Candidatus Phytoplasma rubi]WAN63501.1 hypothetical protein RS022_06670 [Candidatus Phytoplasma rubi]